jgi:hypothetical protein
MIKYLPITGLLTLLVLTLAACVKNDAPVPVAQTVSINVINASEEVLNFYTNGTRQNSSIGLFPLSANGYTNIPYGGLLTFKKVFNNQTFENADVLFSVPVDVDTTGANNRQYSLFTAGLTSSSAFYTRDTIVTDSKNAKLRFVVASPQVTNLDVFMNDTLRFSTKAYKSASTFNAVGNGVKRLQIRAANSSTVLYSTSVTLAVGRCYTLFTQGNTGANPTFKAGLIVNQ